MGEHRPKTGAMEVIRLERIRTAKTRMSVVAMTAVVGALGLVQGAFATGEPTVDASDLTPAFYVLGTTVLAAVVALIGPVLIIKAPFIIVRLALRAIHRLFGRAHPTAA